MERFGLFGLIAIWALNAFAYLVNKLSIFFNIISADSHIELLQIISLYCAILVSVVTLIIRRKEFIKAIRDIIKDLKRKG